MLPDSYEDAPVLPQVSLRFDAWQRERIQIRLGGGQSGGKDDGRLGGGCERLADWAGE